MNKDYWSVFKDTGDPMSYLLCSAAQQAKKPQKAKKDKKNEDKRPAASL